MAMPVARMIRSTFVLAIVYASVCLTLPVSAPLTAQRAEGDLGVQGTMAFNVIWNTANTGNYFNKSATPLRFGEGRYSGRVALRIRSGWYVGASVSTWQFNLARMTGTTTPDAVSEAVDLASYAQLYPLRHGHLFLRGGIGYVRSWAYVGAGNIIQGFKANHLSASTGIGDDVALRPHLAVTLAVDYTRVLGAPAYAEGESALMIGAGLTIH